MAVIDTEHERKRLDVLRSYGILDTPPDNGFDEITALAASIFEVPIALISLVDKDRQWYKSKVGFDVSEAPREASFCDAAIQSSEVMVVTDVTQDPRFMHHPLVTGETEIRFYAGAPLLTAEGYLLGTLCVIDRVARGMSQQQRVTLTLLSRQVVTLLALRKKSDELSGAFVTLQNLHHGLQETQTKLHESEQRLLFALDAAEIGDWNMDLRTNVALRSLRHDQCFGYTEAVPKWGYDTFLEHVHPADRQRVDALYSLAMDGQGNYDVDFRVIWPDGTERCLWSRGRFDFDDLGKPYRVAGIQLDITERKQSEAALIAAKEKAETANQELARSNADLVRSQTALTATNQQLEAQNMLLDESEVRLAGVIDSAHDAIISIDSRHKIVLFNPAAQKMFGHAEAAMLGQTLDALLPQQFRAQHSDHVRSFVREDTSSQRMGGARQLYGLRSDGTEFPIDASISRFRSNAQWQSTVILRDITARKNTELKLQRSENLFSKAEELASIGSWDWDLTGEDSIWSDALFTIYGREKSLGVPKFEAWQETIHPDDHEPLETLINHALTDKRNYATEFRIHTKDTGELRYIDSRGESVLDGDGKVIRIRGVDQDITERKQAEFLQRLLETSVAHLNDAVIITAATPLTARGPRIVFVNEAAERMTGYTRAELIGQTPRLFQGPSTDQAELRRISAALHQMGSVFAEIINYTKAGTEYWVELNITPVLSTAGVTTHFVAIERDITERKQTEAALIAAKENVEAANQELARSNADLEQFAYAASHDLQEPLRSVASSVQLLQKRYEGKLDARADTFIAHAVSGATRMQALIDDLLAFSRIGSKSNQATDISMESALAAAIANLQQAIVDSNAQITHDALPSVQAQSGQMTQLLQNLLANAIKFRGVKPATVHVGARQAGREWVFSVADQGIGIEPKYFNRIFELFKRLHTREEYAGTGIGLALCKKIVERHGGRIWVESEPGRGTTFFFALPSRIPSER